MESRWLHNRWGGNSLRQMDKLNSVNQSQTLRSLISKSEHENGELERALVSKGKSMHMGQALRSELSFALYGWLSSHPDWPSTSIRQNRDQRQRLVEQPTNCAVYLPRSCTSDQSVVKDYFEMLMRQVKGRLKTNASES